MQQRFRLVGRTRVPTRRRLRCRTTRRRGARPLRRFGSDGVARCCCEHHEITALVPPMDREHVIERIRDPVVRNAVAVKDLKLVDAIVLRIGRRYELADPVGADRDRTSRGPLGGHGRGAILRDRGQRPRALRTRLRCRTTTRRASVHRASVGTVGRGSRRVRSASCCARTKAPLTIAPWITSARTSSGNAANVAFERDAMSRAYQGSR